jgi:hypothetical protein
MKLSVLAALLATSQAIQNVKSDESHKKKIQLHANHVKKNVVIKEKAMVELGSSTVKSASIQY